MDIISEYIKYYIEGKINDLHDVWSLFFNVFQNIENISQFLINNYTWSPGASYLIAAVISALIFLISLSIMIGIPILIKKILVAIFKAEFQ